MAASPLEHVLRHLRQFARATGEELGDGELLNRFMDHKDEAAFEQLLQRHGRMVLGVCNSILHDPHDAEDAFQATFLVLVRSGRSVRKQDSLGSWLYRVAYRSAHKARTAAHRRHREEQVAAQSAPTASPPSSSGDYRPVLAEELQRLPEKYRAPLLLYYLGGKTTDETARQLGCPQGTVMTRLMNGRDLLRNRLLRRGVTLSVAGIPMALADMTASAAVSSTSTQATLQAALHTAASTLTAGSLSASVAALTEGVLHAMFIAKIRRTMALVLGLTLLVGSAALLTYQSWAAKDDPLPAVALPDDPQATVLVWDTQRTNAARKTEEHQLHVRADGTVTVQDPYGPGKQVQAKLSAKELQEVMRSVIHTNGFFTVDARKVQNVLQAARLQEGQAIDATGSTTVIRVCADGREHAVRATDLHRHAQGSAETKRLAAIDQRLERLVHWVYAGGKAGLDAAVKVANERLRSEFPDVPPLTADDLQTATQRADGTATVTLERRGVAADKNPFSFVYTRIDRTAQEEPKVTVRAKVDAQLSAKSDDDAGPTKYPLNVEPKPIGTDASVKYDYDIVYVRAPRFIKRADGKQIPTAWPEIGRPYNISAGYDLMLLHPDGSEEVLVPGGEGSVTDPYVSFDAEWVYYAYFHNPAKGAGADIYKIHVKSKKIVRLTEQTWTPNTGVANWSKDFKTPEQGKVHLGGVYNLGPCPVPGGKVAFTSNRDAVKTPRGYPQQALQLFLMDDDGANVDKIGHLNVACALHPVILKDGRLIFSSLESQANRNAILWGIWSIHPDGTNWGPVVSAFSTAHGAPDAFHFQSQLSDGHIVVEEYYNQNTSGFGTYYKMPAAPPDGVAPFGPARVSADPRLKLYGGSGQTLPFGPYGMMALTRFAHGGDNPALLSDPKNPKSIRVGKVTHPCGAPDNHLLTVWAAGSTPSANRGGVPYDDPVDAGIYLLKDGKPIWEPGQMLLVKNDPNYNEQWPRPLVPYQRIYGVDEPARLVHRNDGKQSPHLPEGTPFGLVGTSSMIKRETYPQGVVAKGSVTATGNPYAAFSTDPWLGMNWSQQGGDAGLYENSDIHAVRILAMEPASLPVAGRFFNHARERLRVLGEIPVRKFNGAVQPIDPDGNPDTSFLAKIPADVAFTFQLIDKDGMVLNMAQTWHQLRPGEVRNDCGGCHAHSQKPTLFKDTAAAKADYKVFDLTKVVPLLTSKKNDQSGQKWDAEDETGLRFATGTVDVEFHRDVQPILERSCVACHTQKNAKPAGNLVLDDYKIVDGGSNDNGSAGPVPASFKTLAIGSGATPKTRYIWGFQSRMSPLVWKLFGRNLSGLPAKAPPGLEAQHERYAKALVYQGSIMPPPEAVAGTYEGPDGTKVKVAPLTDEDRRTIVRWIDLGCPLDRDFDAKDPQKRGRGWMLDDQRPTLTLAQPRPGANEALTRLLVGMTDYGSGLDAESFQVTADFPVDGLEPGTNLASKFRALSEGRWELTLAKPITDLAKGKLTVSVKDKQGNVSVVTRTFAVVPPVTGR